MTKTEKTELSFEEKIKKLETIVSELESGDVALEEAEFEIESNNYLGSKKFKRAYMYNFKNPILFDVPKKITIIEKTGSWILFDENKIIDGYRQERLF